MKIPLATVNAVLRRASRKQPTPAPAGALKPAPAFAPPLRSEPVYARGLQWDAGDGFMCAGGCGVFLANIGDVLKHECPRALQSLRSEPVYDHKGQPIPRAGAGAAALDALRQFPRHAIWHGRLSIVHWWRDIAQPIVDALDAPAPPAESSVTLHLQGAVHPDSPWFDVHSTTPTPRYTRQAGEIVSKTGDASRHVTASIEPAGGFICGACGFGSTTAEEMLGHKCPHAPPAAEEVPRHAFVNHPELCVDCGESCFHRNHWMREGKWDYDK